MDDDDDDAGRHGRRVNGAANGTAVPPGSLFDRVAGSLGVGGGLSYPGGRRFEMLDDVSVSPPGALPDGLEMYAGLDLRAVGPVPSGRSLREWSLVLQSMSIWHLSRHAPLGWYLLVRPDDYARASASIERYEAENVDWPPRSVRDRPRHLGSPVAPLVFAALALFFYLVTGPAAGGSAWFGRGTAVAHLVSGAQPWRAVTALTLHSDAVHVIGNAISGAIFASAVDRRMGPGAGALALVASGAAGNVANALWYRFVLGSPGHASIGASTAVFGAIGLLAATQLVQNRSLAGARARRWIDRVAPIAGGLALLGALGSGGARTDLGAHLFGFLAGLAIGFVAALGLRRWGAARPRWSTQLAMGASALGVVVGSWALAFR